MSGVSVRPLTAAGLAGWRACRQVASSAAGRLPGGETEIRRAAPPKPLGAHETHDAMFAQLYANQRKDRDAYERAVRWMRATRPDSVAYMTDRQLRDYLDMRCREAVDRIIRQKHLDKPAIVSW